MEKTCPKCRKEAKTSSEVRKIFGIRKINGKERPQSYCKECRYNKKVVHIKEAEKNMKEKTHIVKHYVPSVEATGMIVKFTEEELLNMLSAIRNAKAISIGVDIKEI